jgi:hypothetical protein
MNSNANLPYASAAIRSACTVGVRICTYTPGEGNGGKRRPVEQSHFFRRECYIHTQE